MQVLTFYICSDGKLTKIDDEGGGLKNKLDEERSVGHKEMSCDALETTSPKLSETKERETFIF